MKGRATQALASAMHFDAANRATRADALAVNKTHLIQQVVQHRRTGSAMKRRRIPKSRYPGHLEASYASTLIGIVKTAYSSIQPLLRELPSLLPSKVDKTDRLDGGAFLNAELDYLDRGGMTLDVFDGIPIVIEYRVGDVRKWTDRQGNSGQTIMRTPYGYIAGSRGLDGEPLDCYVGLSTGLPWVYVVDQMSRASDFADLDEQKVMLGFDSMADARDAYLAQYDDPRFLGAIRQVPMGQFKLDLMAAQGARMYRADAGESKRARDLVDLARHKLEQAVHPNAIEAVAAKAAQAVDQSSKALLAAQARAALGIDVHSLGRDVPARIADFTHENVALIKSLTNTTMDKVETMVSRAFTTGQSHEDLAEELEERFGIATRHAKLIARDQIGKLNSKLTTSRHQELGITSFTWRTVGDDNVRPEHDELDGEEFTYDDPPSEGLPGEPIACRCSPEPVFDMLLDDVESAEDDDSNDDEDADQADDDGNLKDDTEE